MRKLQKSQRRRWLYFQLDDNLRNVKKDRKFFWKVFPLSVSFQKSRHYSFQDEFKLMRVFVNIPNKFCFHSTDTKIPHTKLKIEKHVDEGIEI